MVSYVTYTQVLTVVIVSILVFVGYSNGILWTSTYTESSTSYDTVTYTNSTTPTSTSTSTSSSTSTTSTSTSQNYPFISPYLQQLEGIRAVLMQPFFVGNQRYGFDPAVGEVCGGNVEASPAVGIKAGYNTVCVQTDVNIEGGCSLDYFNSRDSILNDTPGWSYEDTDICQMVRLYLSEPFYAIGGCSEPFQVVSYRASFSLLDRRESEMGFTSPYLNMLDQAGVHIGGIGSSCGTEGQVYYSVNNPMLVAEMPGTPIGPNSGLEELSFYIDEAYMQCIVGTTPCSTWQSAYQNAMSQFPFQAPRQALHFIQATLATQAWTLSNATYDGLTSLQMLQIAVGQVFTPYSQIGPMGVDGDIGPHGGLAQSWGNSNDQTPEANMQAMIAFDPNMPLWFTYACAMTPAMC